MQAFEFFEFGGEPILNMREWCRGRGEKVVKYKACRTALNPVSCEIEVEEYEAEMPETFWNSLRQSDGWNYKQVEQT